jgi:hypothetical protein
MPTLAARTDVAPRYDAVRLRRLQELSVNPSQPATRKNGHLTEGDEDAGSSEPTSERNSTPRYDAVRLQRLQELSVNPSQPATRKNGHLIEGDEDAGSSEPTSERNRHRV